MYRDVRMSTPSSYPEQALHRNRVFWLNPRNPMHRHTPGEHSGERTQSYRQLFATDREIPAGWTRPGTHHAGSQGRYSLKNREPLIGAAGELARFPSEGSRRGFQSRFRQMGQGFLDQFNAAEGVGV